MAVGTKWVTANCATKGVSHDSGLRGDNYSRGKAVLTTITLYKPNGDPITYMEPTNVNVENGVVTFYWVKEISGKAQKIMTNLPFLIQHDVLGH
jgi:hypothetical protein